MNGETDRWQRVRQVFQATLARPDADRPGFLRAVCADDSSLRREVESLLNAHEAAAGHFMESPAIEHLDAPATKQVVAAPEPAERVVGALSVGSRLGPYEIVAALGAGGMGEVYRVRDRRLNRDVALKMLPPGSELDRDHLERFEREVQAVAALNHPNIVTIHSVEAVDGSRFFTMELVEGKTLAETITRHRLTAMQMLEIAIPLADAIAMAHQRGIVHRDLKPTNIMVTVDGRVKVLDFGLAKLLHSERPTGLSTRDLTGEDRIVGTIAYMSPEQAEGKPVDHRSDIFSLGIILYELAAGERPFKGDTNLSVLSSIVKEAPKSLAELNRALPYALTRIVERCLAKNPERRYQTTADLRNDLEEVKKDLASGEPTRRRLRVRAGGIAGVLIVLAVVGGFVFVRRSTDQAPRSTLEVTRLTAEAGMEQFPSLSPDGKWFVYSAGDLSKGENVDIYLRGVGGQTAVNLTKDSIDEDTQPAFSPDGNRIAFRSGRQGGGLFVMGRTGESPRRLTKDGYNPAWSPDGREIVYATARIAESPTIRGSVSELWVVNVETGSVRQLTASQTRDAVQPSWSTHGRRIAFWGLVSDRKGDIFTIPASGGEVVPVTSDAAFDSNPVWSPDGRHLYFSSDRGGSFNVWRVPIDEESGKTLGKPEPVTAPSQQVTHLSFSTDGRHLAYASMDLTSPIESVAFDPERGVIRRDATPVTQGSRLWAHPEASPGNDWLVFFSYPERLHLFMSRPDGSDLRELTDDAGVDMFPRWSPDGTRIAFASNRSGSFQIWSINADGSGRHPLTQYVNGLGWPAWSPDGRRMAANDLTLPGQRAKNLIFDPGKPWNAQTPLEIAPGGGYFAESAWSPDGEWLAGFDRSRPQLGLAVYSLTSHAYERLTDYEGGSVTWLKDSRRILYSFKGKLWIIDTASRKSQEALSVSGEELGWPSLSRDNRTLYFTRSHRESDIWMARLR